MRKALVFLLILALVFTAGCAAKDKSKAAQTLPDNTAADTTKTTTDTTTGASTDTTSAAVSDLESDLADIDSFDDELLSTELDDLDSELNFEI